MKMENKLKLSLVIFGLTVVVSSTSLAQKGKKEDVETITATANREVPEAYRITTAPTIIDTVIKHQETNYSLLSLRYNTSIKVDTIQAANIKLKDKLPQLYNTYVRVGIGYPVMPLADVYYNNGRSRNYFYGGRINHLSGFNKIKGFAPANFDRTKFAVYGGLVKETYKATGEINGNYRGLNYYGVRNESLQQDSIRQRYNEIGFKGSFASHKKDSANFNYRIDLNYSNFMDRKPSVDSLKDWRARENFVELAPKFWYKLGKEIFAVDVALKYNGYKYGVADTSISYLDSGIVNNNTIFQLKPHVTTYAFDNRLKATIGFDLNYDAGVANKFRIYPIVEVKYNVFEDVFVPYLSVGGGLKQNTFRTMSYENEFILSNQQLRNQSNTIHAQVGIRGTISNKIGYNASIDYGNYRDKLLFVTDTLYSAFKNEFRTIYDTMNIAKIEGSIYYQLNEKIKIDVIGRYYSYSLKNEIYAWNLPVTQFILRGSYNLYDKFLVALNFNLEGGRKAKVYEDGPDVVTEDGQFAKKLGFLYDIDLHFEYRYNTRISVFLDLNNVAANRYNRWLNYPVYGFQVMGGFTFRF